MNKMVAVVFDDDRKAYEGLKALKQLHAGGSVTVYSAAVITREADGEIAIRESVDQGPIGTILGVVTGNVVTLLATPRVTTGARTSGTIAAPVHDLAEVGIGHEFFDEVSNQLSLGKVGIIAEVNEDWVTPLDTEMEPLGGVITRSPRSELLAAQLRERFQAESAEFAKLQAEFNHAVGHAKTRLKSKIDAAREKLQSKRSTFQEKMERVNQEGNAKIKALQEQAANASDEMKENLNKRVAEIRTDYKKRADKLHQAWEVLKKAS